MDVGQLLTLLLGGGALATITALFNGVKSLREGSRSRERDTIKDLIEQRKEAWSERDEAFDLRDNALDQRDFWRERAGTLDYLCRTHGVEVPPLPQEPTRTKELTPKES